MQVRERLRSTGPLSAAAVSILILLIAGPLAVLLFSTAKLTKGALPFEDISTYTSANYREVFLSSGTYELVWNTTVLTVGALVVAFSLAVAMAWLVERTTFPFRNTIFVLIIASLGIPGFISAIGWSFILNPTNGLLNELLRDVLGLGGSGPLNLYSMPGMIMLEGLRLVPVTFLLLTAAFRAIDATLEDAGIASGARPSVVLRRITIPLLTPAILSALVYQLASTLESFDIPALIGLRAGIPVLSTRIFLEVRPAGGLPDYGLASTYGLLLIAVVLVPLLYYQRILRRAERFATVSGNTYAVRRATATPRVKIIGSLLLGMYLLVNFVVPLVTLVWTSLQPFYAPPSMEALSRIQFDAYTRIFHNEFARKAFVNTVVVGVVTASATVILGFVLSWTIVRSRSRFRSLLDTLSFVPHSIPTIVLGLGVALIYLYLPVPIYGTVWILIIALGTRYISIATRQTNTAIGQVQRSLEDASAASGAAPGQTLRRVLLPLVAPAMFNGFLLVMLLSIKNLVLPLILSGRDSVVLSSVIWNLWDTGDTAGTAALSLMFVGLTLTLAALSRRASSSSFGG